MKSVRPDVLLVVAALALLGTVALVGEIVLAVYGKASPAIIGYTLSAIVPGLTALLAKTDNSTPQNVTVNQLAAKGPQANE